jgi:hypothetical protein
MWVEKRNGPEKDLWSRLGQLFQDPPFIYQFCSNLKEKGKEI